MFEQPRMKATQRYAPIAEEEDKVEEHSSEPYDEYLSLIHI